MSAICGLLLVVWSPSVRRINPLRPPELSVFFVVVSHSFISFFKVLPTFLVQAIHSLMIVPFSVTYFLLVCTSLTRHIL